jgi:ribosomal protein L33
MKRVLVQKQDFSGLKPVYGSAGESPFYDPYDAHVHKWTKGVILTVQDHKDPGYKSSQNPENAFKMRKYCTVCHELEKTSTISTTTTTTMNSIDKLDPIDKKHVLHNDLNLNFSNFQLSPNEDFKNSEETFINEYRDNLFTPKEGIYKNYVIFKD